MPSFFNTIFKKKYSILLIILICFLQNLWSQIPTVYYESANNKADTELKSKLNQIIDDHVEFPYTAEITDVWDILKETDRDPDNPNNVILVYSGISINAAQEFNLTRGWIREHVWAKSRGEFGTDAGPGTDVHALRPLDFTTNIKRNNRSFDNCINCEVVTDKWDNDTGSKRDDINYTFEPRDAVKGDVARMLFYMDVRYEGTDGYVNLEVTESSPPLGNNEPILGVLPTLLEWHRNDPVDEWEINRNNIIYNNYQNNRNPFIDHPELAEHLWGTKKGEAWIDTTESSENPIEEVQPIVLYPIPASNILNIQGITETVEVKIFDALGRTVISRSITPDKNQVDVSRLSGRYQVRLTIGEIVISRGLIVK